MGNVRLIPHTDSHYTTSLIRVDNWAYFIFMSLLQSILECGYTNRRHHFCSQGWSTAYIYLYKSIKLNKIICKSLLIFPESKKLAEGAGLLSIERLQCYNRHYTFTYELASI